MQNLQFWVRGGGRGWAVRWGRLAGRRHGQMIYVSALGDYILVMSDFVKKCCQCYCFSSTAYNVAMCIDTWHSIEACGLSYLYCDACCWTIFSPLCIDCKLGETGKAMENFSKGIKYCVFACALSCVGSIDGCYNCFKVIQTACGDGIKGYADLTKNTEFLGNKVKEALGLETGNEPLRSMGTFTP